MPPDLNFPTNTVFSKTGHKCNFSEVRQVRSDFKVPNASHSGQVSGPVLLWVVRFSHFLLILKKIVIILGCLGGTVG